MKHQKVTDREFYPAIWILLLLLGLGYGVWRYGLGRPTISGCWIWQHWHIYCPGCGGTRSLIALLQGDIIASAYYHPALLILVVTLGVYMISQTVWRVRKRRGWVLHYHPSWASCMLGILLINCMIRNILWLGFGIAMT